MEGATVEVGKVGMLLLLLGLVKGWGGGGASGWKTRREKNWNACVFLGEALGLFGGWGLILGVHSWRAGHLDLSPRHCSFLSGKDGVATF